MCGADCYPVSEAGTGNILASDSSSESPRPTWLFFMAGKDWSQVRFGSKYSTPLWIFRKDKIVGVTGVHSLVLVGRKRDRGKTRSSCVLLRDFCSLPVGTNRCGTNSSSVHWKLISSVCFLPFLGSRTRAILPVFAVMLYLLQ